MVKTSYMLDKPARTDVFVKFISQHLLPAAIDTASVIEGFIEDVALRARRKPMWSLCAAVALGMLASILSRV